MAERPQAFGSGQRYDREGLYRWAKQRFAGVAQPLTEEECRTQSRAYLQERLLDISRSYFPKRDQFDIDERLEEAYRGTKLSEPEDAAELVEWAKQELKLEVPVESLTGVTQENARQVLWNAFDAVYRPEMYSMERSLILNRLDAAWKNHLYIMDHLRSTVGLRSYAQEDPKTVYKREGMKEFDAMWEGVQDKVTDAVFRMEDEEAFQESLWAIGTAIHEAAPRAMAAGSDLDAALQNQQSGKKPEPIRNRGERVGRNDPCPCGSGKKYKNCCMKQAV
ncbi:MAG: SEC-C metal-binding domain-containing protein [Gemmataceae bacterium]|nr:SEC-C metal-binding domain-containing protein [Gemmataceae bacterium]